MIEKPNYWQKQKKMLYSDLLWNLPEQKQSSISIIGGNSQSFSTVNRVSTSFSSFPVRDVISVLPDSLRKKIPPVPNVKFCPSTETGSFKKSTELQSAFELSDFNVLIGDFTKNSETSVAVAEALKFSKKPCLITRDTIDLVLNDMLDIVEKENLIIVGTMTQIQKIFRSVYYPKVLLLSMPIFPVVEALHKFTLTYQVTILTFQEENIIVAKNGEVITTKISETNYSPLTLWSGELSAKIAVLNLFNPKNALKATSTALFA